MCEQIFLLVTIEYESCAGSIADLTFCLVGEKIQNVEIFFMEPGAAASHNTDFF